MILKRAKSPRQTGDRVKKFPVYVGTTTGIAAILALPAFITMLILGAILGSHDLYTPGFWETWGGLIVISIVGSCFNSSLKGQTGPPGPVGPIGMQGEPGRS
jgi:hypothetical protein